MLSRFYSKHNPEKLATIKALATQFFGKDDTLNRLLKERYDTDLNDMLLATQGNPDTADGLLPNHDQDSMLPTNDCDDPSNRPQYFTIEDNCKWEATMSSIDSAVSKADVSSSANLSAIVKATSKALKAALQENQELKTINADLCVQLEHRY